MKNEIENRNKSLWSGTLVYFVGNVLTQVISILLLKLITGSVGTADYGYFSLVITVDNLITPMITLQISDAVFKFFIVAKSEDEKKKIISSGTIVILLGIIVTTTVIFVCKSFIEYPLFVALYIVSTNIFAYIQKVARSFGKNREYVVANLMKAVLYFAIMFLCFNVYKMGIEGLFIANCLSMYICIVYLLIKIGFKNYFCIHEFCVDTTKSMISFSAPLIPNTAIWWFQSSVNSFILTAYLGFNSNGIYSVALKLASVLHLVTNVFDLAWQESVIKEFMNPGYKKFVTDIMNKYIVFVFSCVAMSIPIISILSRYLIDISYYDAINYIPFLLISTSFAACSSFFGQMLVAKNKNIKLLYTNIIGTASNIVIMVALIKFLGLWAVVISANLTYGVVAFTRFTEVKEDFIVSLIDFKKIILCLVMIVAACLTSLFCNTLCRLGVLMLVMTLAFFLNKKLIEELVSVIFEKLKA